MCFRKGKKMACHNLKAKAMHVISVHLANPCIFAIYNILSEENGKTNFQPTDINQNIKETVRNFRWVKNYTRVKIFKKITKLKKSKCDNLITHEKAFPLIEVNYFFTLWRELLES